MKIPPDHMDDSCSRALTNPRTKLANQHTCSQQARTDQGRNDSSYVLALQPKHQPQREVSCITTLWEQL